MQLHVFKYLLTSIHRGEVTLDFASLTNCFDVTWWQSATERNAAEPWKSVGGRGVNKRNMKADRMSNGENTSKERKMHSLSWPWCCIPLWSCFQLTSPRWSCSFFHEQDFPSPEVVLFYCHVVDKEVKNSQHHHLITKRNRRFGGWIAVISPVVYHST